MRTYPGMRLAPTMGVPQLREELQRVDTYLKLVSDAFARVALAPQGSGPAGGNTGVVPDLSQFWYLPGRLPEQRAFGRNAVEGISVSATGSGTPTVTQKLGIFAHDQNKGVPSVWFGVEGTDHALINSGHADRPYHQDRYWVFPAFNQLDQGETNGVHFFADTSDYQVLTNKTLSGWVLETQDSAGIGIVDAANRGETETGTTKALVLVFHGSFPTTTWRRSSNSPSGGSYPSLAIPPLDVNAGVTAPQREKQHILCVMRKDHTDLTPFEDGGLMMGGGTGRELYPMFTTAQGTLAAPADKSLPLWHPSVTKSCNFTTSSASVEIPSGTAGIYKGQRMRETTASYSLKEDMHVLSIDDGTHITMSDVWTASPLTRTVQFFGMTWSDSATSVTLDHGALTGLTDDDHPQYLLLLGRAGGQVIGTGSLPTGGTVDDIKLSGRLYMGTSTVFQDGTAMRMDISDNNVTINSAGTPTLTRWDENVTATGAGAGMAYILLTGKLAGGGNFTSGTFGFTGMSLTIQPNAPAGVSCTSSQMFNGQIQMIGAGSATLIAAGLWDAQASTLAATVTTVKGFALTVSHRGSTVTSVKALEIAYSAGAPTGTATDCIAIDILSSFGNHSGVGTWHAIRHTAGPTAAITDKWFLDLTSTASNLANRLLYRTAIGWTPANVAAVTAKLMLAAGTTAASSAPLKFQTGTNNTVAEAGAMEWDGTRLYVTNATPARKTIAYTDDTLASVPSFSRIFLVMGA